MRCVPNLTEVVVGQCPITQLVFSKSSIIVFSLSNSHQLRSTTTRSVITLSLPCLRIKRTRFISICSIKVRRNNEWHEVIITIHIKLVVLLELILSDTGSLTCSRINRTKLSQNQVLNL